MSSLSSALESRGINVVATHLERRQQAPGRSYTGVTVIIEVGGKQHPYWINVESIGSTSKLLKLYHHITMDFSAKEDDDAFRMFEMAMQQLAQ